MLSAVRHTTLVTVTSLLIAPCGEPLHPTTPPILKNVSGDGWVWNGGCSSSNNMFSGSHEALSPELTHRLADQFPAGSDAGLLEQALREQGFEM